MKIIQVISIFIFLTILCSCNDGSLMNGVVANAEKKPIGSVPETPPPSSSGEEHIFGKARETAHATEGNEIPISFVFINSSSQILTNNAETEANKAIDIMNQKFMRQGLAYVKFNLKSARTVVDDLYFNTSCNQLGKVAAKYGTGNSMVMVVVNDLAGGCAGVSFLWKFPADKMAVTMSEFTDPFVHGRWTPVIHEFAHSFGLHHTGDEYPGSVPSTGLKTFNALLPSGGDGRSCNAALKYFIDPQKRHNGAEVDGVVFDSYHNTMYPSYGGQEDAGFFTAGYDYSMSWAFDCWYQFAKDDI